MDTESKIKMTIQELEKFKRIAFVPNVISSERAHSDHSKYGGLPYLRNQNDWPTCVNCGKHLTLFLQLNLRQFPVRQEEGLIQLFYCTNEERDCANQLNAFQPFSQAVVCRRINVNLASAIVDSTSSEVFEEKLIVSWSPRDDFPHWEERHVLHLDQLAYCYEVIDQIDAMQLFDTIEEDKLFGWPFWVQAEEYPHDRTTNKRMELLFQIGLSKHIPFDFGDEGIGHLTISPDNTDELAFAWACS